MPTFSSWEVVSSWRKGRDVREGGCAFLKGGRRGWEVVPSLEAYEILWKDREGDRAGGIEG